jgi:hypothetical protein
MSPSRSGYKELGLDLVEPLQDQPRKPRRPPMGEEKKDEGEVAKRSPSEVVHIPAAVSNIKYKKGRTNNVADCLSRPPIKALTTVLNSCGHETFDWSLLYKSDPEFGHTYNRLLEGKKVPNFHLQDALLCHLGHLCAPSSERPKMIWEAHYSRVAGHFGVEKTVAVLQKYFYWPNLRQDVEKYIKSCIACAIAKTTINKQGLYTPLPTLVDLGNPSPWITCRAFLLLSMAMTVFLWSSTDSRRCPL